MIITKKQKVIIPSVIGFLTVVSATIFFLFNQHQVDAAVSGWQPGNIMSNYVMTNTATMSAKQIQSFLNKKTPTCDINGTQISEFSGGKDYNKDGKITRSEWGRYKYGQTKFYCLRYYGQNGRSAAQIIYDTSRKYSINPQVLLVLLQKEQGLVTDAWPLNVQYRSATGYGCPDTAPCDSDYYGLTNQLDWAAKMFRAILNNSPSWYTPYELGNNFIRYSPTSSCGGRTVYIENRATQALYNYTPYQPNSAALNAGWGKASCGAYGNRNFYLYFTSWFGSTRANYKFTELLSARWMQTKTNTYKKNPYTGENIDGVIPAGTKIYFPTKITTDSGMYLRTQIDSKNGSSKGIPYSALEEIDVTFSPLLYPRWMELKRDARKVDPQTSETLSAIPAGTQIFFPSKFEIGGQTYLRTQNDTEAGLQKAIPLSDLQDSDISYESFVSPRWMTMTKDTYLYDTKSTKTTGSVIVKGTQKYFDKKITVNGVTYAHHGTPSAGSYIGVPLPDTEEVQFSSLLRPRWMRTAHDGVYKKDPMTGQNVGIALPKNTEIEFTTKILINDTWYLRTKTDTKNNNRYGIPLDDLIELPNTSTPLSFSPFLYPRWMTPTTNVYKKYPRTGENEGSVIPAGTKFRFVSKVLVGDTWYARTAEDSMYGITQGIPLSSLQDTTAP